MKTEHVTVLMSTYNGGGDRNYIREQIESILNQKGVEVSLCIRDDGSTDNTVDIIREYAQKNDAITLINDGENLGACRSFLKLISTEMDSEYFALADQDDVWDEDKLAVAIEKLKELPSDKPALYYSNQRIVDMNGAFLRLSQNEPQVAKTPYGFLAEPLAVGCTCVYNRKLSEIAWKTKPTDYSMHDTWIYNAAAMFGNTVFDSEPHMNYRQHENNVIGTAKKQISFEGIRKQLHFIWIGRANPGINAPRSCGNSGKT